MPSLAHMTRASRLRTRTEERGESPKGPADKTVPGGQKGDDDDDDDDDEDDDDEDDDDEDD